MLKRNNHFSFLGRFGLLYAWDNSGFLFSCLLFGCCASTGCPCSFWLDFIIFCLCFATHRLRRSRFLRLRLGSCLSWSGSCLSWSGTLCPCLCSGSFLSALDWSSPFSCAWSSRGCRSCSFLFSPGTCFDLLLLLLLLLSALLLFLQLLNYLLTRCLVLVL